MASLGPIVEALGGELSACGRRALVRAPGHSAADRSVSLMLSGSRVVIYSFGAATWQEVHAHLLSRGLIDRTGSVSASGSRSSAFAPLRPDAPRRIRIARRLWDEAGAIVPGSASMRHLVLRLGTPTASASASAWEALRHHPAAPVSVFREGGPRRPALLARVDDPGGRFSAVEITYLTPDGRPADGLRLRRKTVGAVPPGAAVRLDPWAPHLLVGEGVMTVLSAAARFGMPAWALLSVGNLSAWSAPPGVRKVLIAADRGPAGEQGAARLARRLRRAGVAAEIALPPSGHGDWNEAAVASGRRE